MMRCSPTRFLSAVISLIRLTYALPAHTSIQIAIANIEERLVRLEQQAESFDITVVNQHASAQAAKNTACPSLHCPSGQSAYQSFDLQFNCSCVRVRPTPYQIAHEEAEETDFQERYGLATKVKIAFNRRNLPTMKDINFTYVPPPKTDITPELIQQSLTVQPQDTATVASINPQFRDGVIMFGIQLNGLVADTITLNASTSLPCDTIGTPIQPDLVLHPRMLINATATPVIPDCQIIAVNMYDPLIVTYWVQRQNGGIFSLTGSNKVEQINQIDSSLSTALVIRTRGIVNRKRHSGLRGTKLGRDALKAALGRKAIEPVDVHTATMTAEACAAMKCINNGGEPALFNPFRNTCGCAEPVLVEMDSST